MKPKVIPIIIGATRTISRSFRKYLNNIPVKQEIKELQNTVLLGNEHTRRKAGLLMQVQKTQHAKNNYMYHKLLI